MSKDCAQAALDLIEQLGTLDDYSSDRIRTIVHQSYKNPISTLSSWYDLRGNSMVSETDLEMEVGMAESLLQKWKSECNQHMIRHIDDSPIAKLVGAVQAVHQQIAQTSWYSSEKEGSNSSTHSIPFEGSRELALDGWVYDGPSLISNHFDILKNMIYRYSLVNIAGMGE